MDYVTRQFINLTKQLRKELRKYQETLHRDLSHLSDGIKNLKDTISEQGKACEKSNEAKPVSVTDFRSNVPISVQDETKKTIPEWVWVVFKGAVETIGIAAVVGYTYFAYNQWQEQIDATNLASRQTELSRKALNETIKQFQMDQRPRVGIQTMTTTSPVENGMPHLVIGMPIVVNIVIQYVANLLRVDLFTHVKSLSTGTRQKQGRRP